MRPSRPHKRQCRALPRWGDGDGDATRRHLCAGRGLRENEAIETEDIMDKSGSAHQTGSPRLFGLFSLVFKGKESGASCAILSFLSAVRRLSPRRLNGSADCRIVGSSDRRIGGSAMRSKFQVERSVQNECGNEGRETIGARLLAGRNSDWAPSGGTRLSQPLGVVAAPFFRHAAVTDAPAPGKKRRRQMKREAEKRRRRRRRRRPWRWRNKIRDKKK